MATTDNSCFWMVNFYKSSPLKLLAQMNWNMVGSIYGRSSEKIVHFIPDPITNMEIADNYCFWLVDFWWKIFSSKTASPNEVNLGRQHTICPLTLITSMNSDGIKMRNCSSKWSLLFIYFLANHRCPQIKKNKDHSELRFCSYSWINRFIVPIIPF